MQTGFATIIQQLTQVLYPFSTKRILQSAQKKMDMALIYFFSFRSFVLRKLVICFPIGNIIKMSDDAPKHHRTKFPPLDFFIYLKNSPAKSLQDLTFSKTLALYFGFAFRERLV